MDDEPIKVLHVLANSRPDLNGYAVRTHDLLAAQLGTGLILPIGLTSPFYPERETMAESCEVDGIQYLRCAHPHHDASSTGIGAWWLRRRASIRIRSTSKPPQQETDATTIAIDSTDVSDTESIPPSTEEEMKETEIASEPIVLGVLRILFHQVRKIIRRIWRTSVRTSRRVRRVVKKSIRSVWRASVRTSRKVRRFLRPGPMWIEERILMRKMEDRVKEIARDTGAQIIHAHTPYRVGRPALRASRKLGLPFIYEMRGMWEETAVASGRWKVGGLAHRRFRKLETKTLLAADYVVCISETLRDEAISRGVDADRITVVSNAVDPETMFPVDDSPSQDELDHHAETVAALNVGENTTVVGYIGSLRDIEGVDDTATAVAHLVERGLDVRLLVVTGTANQQQLRDHCANLGLGDKAMVTGPVPRHRVHAYYSLIDIFVVSRPDTRVTRLVTPLKPFEAMLLGKPTVCSDLPALAEIIVHEQRGLLYPAGDTVALADAIQRLLEDDGLASRLSRTACAWVEKERVWPTVVKRSLEVYRTILSPSSER